MAINASETDKDKIVCSKFEVNLKRKNQSLSLVDEYRMLGGLYNEVLQYISAIVTILGK